MFVAILLALLVSFAVRLLFTWPIMLLFGVVHLDIWPVIPAFSFWDTFIIAILTGLLTANASANTD